MNIINNFEAGLLTHSKYLAFLLKHSSNLEIEYKSKLNNLNFKLNQDIYRKKRIIGLTHKYLLEESEQIKYDSEFARISCSWIAVKTYYLIFHMFNISKYLMDGSQQGALNRIDHEGLLNWIHTKINEKELIFSNSNFNKLFL